MICIIDYNLGNPASIKNMIRYIAGGDCIITNKLEDLQSADQIILPGVGHFQYGMEQLNNFNLISILNHEVLVKKKPILGICLGMQLMTNFSEEGNCKGLGWVDAQTIKFQFPAESKLKVPHMGWNDVHYKKPSTITQGISLQPRNYFVHSYFVSCNNKSDILATSSHGVDFVSAFEHENIIGMQFHPEKSHKYGMELLKNFCKI